ncbi:MAG: CHASE domain-containing protein [Gemmobacter sp.]|uniref:CHASE domain-containing protein n=1 Tax=Gemmobacter sp. TaxID=1898957 RepID=UPI001A484D76|nr:CHASE domain-containing protein [Gemmobacter sp.]MBL8561060.1 CHASE domain-containing protein [Gemmobacter sp.]
MRTRLGPYLPQIAFSLALILGAGMTFAVHRSAEQRAVAQFQREADLAVDRVFARLRQHLVMLRAAQGLFAASGGAVSREEFRRFLAAFDGQEELGGVQGIGFARMIPARQSTQAETEIRLHYGQDVTLRPTTTDQPWRTPIVLLEPQDSRNRAALGFDMFSDPSRRRTMEQAMSSGSARMTGPVKLVQEITANKQTGFLIYLPYSGTPVAGGPPVAGFVYAPFRGGDLFHAALAAGPELSIALRVTDAGAVGEVLFDGLPPGETDGHRLTRVAEVLGRQWVFHVQETGSSALRHFGTALMAAASILLATATGFAMTARQQEAARARDLAAAAAREADYRGLLIDEMKHRIKNHIARIQSIARQSARSAADLRSFSESFDARLQAMAGAQEVLAGTAVPQADLASILRRELQQCLDTAEVDHLIDGPPVRLDERQSHAFALIAHELVTNAMKYGGLSAHGSGLAVRWQVTADHQLALDWIETARPQPPKPAASKPAAPGRGGFGSRLIEASLQGELAGHLTRDFTPEGLHIRLHFPLKPALQA